MAKKVTTIPATVSRFTAAPVNTKEKRKVAGYARVSTDREEQLTSYEAQLDYYTNYIQSKSDWEFVGMYSDEGISATNTKRRDGFNQMVTDALARKIDLIITKSVSRFARNTVDSLTTVRKLKEKGIEIYFEKENIWTLDSKGELLITIMSSLAQEESRSISENTTWGQRKRFADGKASVGYSHFLGYDRGPNGGFVINPKQAETVRLIYKLFLSGLSYYAVAKELTRRGLKTPAGKDRWGQTTVKSILMNEKYKGDALLQKEFTVDFLTKKKAKNEGQIPQYYVEGDHEAIISPELFQMTQLEIERRNESTSRYSGIGIFSSKIKCGQCGCWYGAKVWHSNDQYRRIIYRCNRKYNGEKCSTHHVTEDEIKEKFLQAANRLFSRKDELIAEYEKIKDVLTDVSVLEERKENLQMQMELAVDRIQRCIAENARIAQDQEEYEKQYNNLAKQYEKAKAELETVMEEITDRTARSKRIEQFITDLKKAEGSFAEWEDESWSRLIDHVTVYEKDDIRFCFRNEMEIRV